MSPMDRQRHTGDTADISASEKRYSYLGRPSSWAAVALMIFGFLVGGIGLTLGPPDWAVVIGGAVLFVIGIVIAYAIDIFKDTGVSEGPEKYLDDSLAHGESPLSSKKERDSQAS